MRCVKWVSYLMLTAALFVFTPPLTPAASAQQPWPSAAHSAAINHKCAHQTCEELHAKARAQGSVNVIIELHAPGLPDESHLPQQERPAVLRARQAAVGQAQDSFLPRLNLRNVKAVVKFKLTPGIAMTVDAETLKDLIADPEVIGIQEERLDRTMLPQTVPLIGADQAWVKGLTGTGYAIAILDTGVARQHPFLAGKVVAEACFSGSIPGAISLCPNGLTSQTGPGAGVSCTLPGCDHGTHVAGIAAGKGANFAGVATDAEIISIQIFSRFNDPATCAGLNATAPCLASVTRDQISALDEVRAMSAALNVAAVNMSLGGGAFTAVCDSDSRRTPIDALRRLKVATVVAAGNGGLTNALSAPACISSTVSVGATTKADRVADYSNSASFLSLLAPGGDGSEFFCTPSVTGFWPGNGVSGSLVFVFGSRFVPGQSRASINGIAAPVLQVLDSTLLFFLLPAGNTAGPIAITTPFGSNVSSTNFGASLPGLQITGLWPAQGPVGSLVFVFGQGFVGGQTRVSIGGVNAPVLQLLDSNLLFFLVPSGAGTGTVTVATPAGSVTSTGVFTVGPVGGGSCPGAPGSIYASIPGDLFGYKSGTSMAAPHAAGAFAVLRQLSPSATVSDILTMLQSNGVLITDARNNIAKPRIRLSNIP
jgi:subtilisin family serine protease